MRKKALLAVFLCMGAATLCYAENYAVHVLVSAPDASSAQVATGTVDSVSVADSAKGLRSELIIIGESGARQVLIVKGTTTIYDAAWKPTGLDVLRKNDRVRVKYVTTGEGLTEALSIRQLK